MTFDDWAIITLAAVIVGGLALDWWLAERSR